MDQQSIGRRPGAPLRSSPVRVSIGLLCALGSISAGACSTSLERSTGATTTTSEPEIEIPTGVLVAVPLQNREDPAKGRFQVKIVNGTRERFDVSSVQFVWAGLTTDVVPRDSTVVGGQRIDFPVPIAAATCVGDGTAATVLPAGADSVEVPIRFTEGRCDPHALAEVKQPHEFVLQVDLGDGVLLPHVVRPDPSDFEPMRRTADEACVTTGQVVFVGD